MGGPYVSVLIDTYNCGRFIEQAIESVLSQDYAMEQVEILVVDDGSTDDTAERVKKYGAKIRYLRKENGGQASAFNLGFAESRGEIVAILDGDDWWAQGKLRTALKALEENPQIAAVGHGYHEFQEDTQEVRTCQPDDRMLVRLTTAKEASTALKAWGFLLASALTVRRKVLEWILPLPEEMVFMADAPIQMAAMFQGTLVLEEPFHYYRRHSQNLFAIDARDKARLRRKSKMANLVFRQLPGMFIRRGVPSECVWALLLLREEHFFQSDPPGRARFLWFLLRQNYWRGSEQTWRFTAWNYLTALGALYFGYEKHASMYEWRGRATEGIERWYKRVLSLGA
jgi:glycosyltransferase involved in cell wall biosynthesis